jgi:hypothetical protein
MELSGILGRKGDEVRRGWRKLYNENEGLHKFFPSPI